MKYQIRLTDSAQQRMAVLSLEEAVVKQAAIDIVFDVLGTDNPQGLVSKGILPDGQVEDFVDLQNVIFDRDDQGAFIREDVNFKANGKDLNPDEPLIGSFVPAEHGGESYKRLDLTIFGGAQPSAREGAGDQAVGQQMSPEELVKEFARLFFLHQVAIGTSIDVTKEYPELIDVIKWAEAKAYVEVDVKNVKYKLTAAGQRFHDQYIEEAQNLIKRYDIYSDVDVDSSGFVRFDTGLGQDLRVPAFELAGVDPFRARFLLGLNDGEWNKLDDWMDKFENPDWYASIFEAIEKAPSIDEIGKKQMADIMEQAKFKLRQEQTGNSFPSY